MIEQFVSLAGQIAMALKEREERIAVIDGATGGLISASLLTIPGATGFYVGGGIVYSQRVRCLLLGLDETEFRGIRSVNEPYALLQARSVRDNFGADWGIAESGSAGPGKHPHGMDAGISAMAVAGPGGFEVSRMVHTGDEDRVRNMQAFTREALTLLRDALQRK